MNLIDWILVVLVLLYALSGYWQGFIAGACATVGLVLGGLLGIWLAPKVLGHAEPSVWVSLGALFVVLVCASVGQAVFQYGGARLRARIRWQPIRAVDAVGGAVLSAVAVLVVTWMIGVAVTGSGIPRLTSLVNDSTVLRTVNRIVPSQAQTALQAFDKVVGSSFFPRYLEPFARERIVGVPAAPARVVHDPDVERAERSVFKVRGNNSCGNGVEGTGFLYYPGRVMTNAHVVAGVSHPQVRVGSRMVDATVVYYDKNTDVAVLSVPSLRAPLVKFAFNGKQGQAGAVLGFPQDGPFNAQPARIRSEQRLRSPDIYGSGTVTREVFSLRSLVRPGNSGGPLVGTDGRVLGVVFAASVSDTDTGYALTSTQVRTAAERGIGSDSKVSSGGCA